jgi:hypothetical protein
VVTFLPLISKNTAELKGLEQGLVVVNLFGQYVTFSRLTRQSGIVVLNLLLFLSENMLFKKVPDLKAALADPHLSDIFLKEIAYEGLRSEA